MLNTKAIVHVGVLTSIYHLFDCFILIQASDHHHRHESHYRYYSQYGYNRHQVSQILNNRTLYGLVTKGIAEYQQGKGSLYSFKKSSPSFHHHGGGDQSGYISKQETHPIQTTSLVVDRPQVVVTNTLSEDSNTTKAITTSEFLGSDLAFASIAGFPLLTRICIVSITLLSLGCSIPVSTGLTFLIIYLSKSTYDYIIFMSLAYSYRSSNALLLITLAVLFILTH